MTVIMKSWWGDAGTEPPAMYSYTAIQPIADYDNWINYSLVLDIHAVIDEVITRYGANTILKADVANTPLALTVAPQTVVGRKTGGSIDAIAIGIANDDIVQIDAAVVADNDYAKFTVNGLEGRSFAEVRSDINVENGATADQTKADIDALGINASQVDGCDAGVGRYDVFKIPDSVNATIYQFRTEWMRLEPVGAGLGGQHLTSSYDHGDLTFQYPAWGYITGKPSYATRWPSWTEVTSKPSTFTPSAHNQSAATITSGTLPVSRGGTGVTGDTYDADKVDGCDAGSYQGAVFKIGTEVNSTVFGVFYKNVDYSVECVAQPTADGYKLTCDISGAPYWATASDLIFSDTHCPKCGLEFQAGEILVLYLIGKNEVGDILTIPMHQSCANAPKKTVMIKRKVMEDQFILDELTGETKIQRVQKMQEKAVTKHKLKEGYALDNKTGKAHKVDKDGKREEIEYNLSDVLETAEETINEVVFEDVEYTL